MMARSQPVRLIRSDEEKSPAPPALRKSAGCVLALAVYFVTVFFSIEAPGWGDSPGSRFGPCSPPRRIGAGNRQRQLGRISFARLEPSDGAAFTRPETRKLFRLRDIAVAGIIHHVECERDYLNF